ncbi:hypothetical protein FGO68_gene16050 [Halteria grandinella]|uniref:Uncharacterized protein n=1 Tax=Halteria grandinella TaxID=5974 RepID=A0A8J8NMU4_HALGN|nr:hypothetical protein FGO68_gene16050 [Halteria grandinella]
MTLEGTTGSSKFKFKVVFLGDQSVGKTSIIHRFIYDSFDDNYQATIGIDFMSHKMFVEDKIIILNLWDTAGQERFKSLIPSYIKDSAVAIVVFDLTSRSSFASVEKWIEDARSLRDDEVLLVLAGNKCDVSPDQHQVNSREVQTFADSKGLMYFELSAKEGINITQMFNEVAKKLTGLETDPIKRSEIKNTGFSLEQAQTTAQNATKSEQKKKSNNCAC